MNKAKFALIASLAGIGFSLSAPIANAQGGVFGCPDGSACTDPVGYVTSTLKGSADGVAQRITLVGLGLFNAIEYQSEVTTVDPGDLVVNLTAGDLDGVDYTPTDLSNPDYFIEIVTGTHAGLMFDIADNDNNSLTLTQAATGIDIATESIRVRKHWKLGGTVSNPGVFGPSNEAGLLASDNITAADLIQVFSPAGSKTYWYAPGAGGWIDGAVFVNNVTLYPDQGIVVRRLGQVDIDLQLLGAVKTGVSGLTLENGFSIVGNVYPTPVTLADSGLFTGSEATGVRANDTITQADTIRIIDGTGAIKTYWYAPSAGGWIDGSNFADDVEIPVGGAIVLDRKAASINFIQPEPYAAGN
jgi:hypothetical protein